MRYVEVDEAVADFGDAALELVMVNVQSPTLAESPIFGQRLLRTSVSRDT
jgi:hypothetical protein